jgi:thioredoxin-dependent peroxiredoxin
MAGKGSARKSVKSSKRKAVNKMPKKSGATSRKQQVRREPAKKAPTKGRSAPKRAVKKSSARPAVPIRAVTVAKSPAPSARAAHPSAVPPRTAPAPAGPKSSKSKGAKPAGHQGALEFEVGPPPQPQPPVGLPVLSKRRGSKPGGPDWPGENLTVGMPAPDFELPSTLGRKVTLQEFRGKRVILYFYPKDDTPGCTMEACAFRDNLPRIVAKDGVVLGISLDDELSHQRFAQKYNLPFPLLADVDAAVCRRYGVYKEKNMYGRSFWGIERTTFVIDRDGKVENVFRRVKVEGHADEVLATLAV